MKKFFSLLHETIRDWRKDDASRESAVLAFFAMLSLPSFLFIVVIIGNLFLDEQAVQSELTRIIERVIGGDIRLLIGVINNAPTFRELRLETIVSVGVLLLGVRGMFLSLKHGLNRLWHIQSKTYTGLQGVKHHVLNTIVMVLVLIILGLLVIATMFVDILFASSLISGNPSSLLPSSFAHAINIGVSFFLIMSVIAILFMLLPDVIVRWKDVLIGAGVSAFLLTVGKYFITWYIGHSAISNAYGVASSSIVIMLWIYYSAFIFFLGAELTRVYAATYGTPIIPNPHAFFLKSLRERIRSRLYRIAQNVR